MDAEQRQKLGALLAQEHVLVITTQGEEWPTATMQAFAETKDLDLKKNPFEEPFFKYDALRMVRVAPKRISYANGVSDAFAVEL